MFPINLRSLNFSKCRNPTSEKADCIDSIQELVIILKEICKIIIFAFRLNPMRNKVEGEKVLVENLKYCSYYFFFIVFLSLWTTNYLTI